MNAKTNLLKHQREAGLLVRELYRPRPPVILSRPPYMSKYEETARGLGEGFDTANTPRPTATANPAPCAFLAHPLGLGCYEPIHSCHLRLRSVPVVRSKPELFWACVRANIISLSTCYEGGAKIPVD